MVIDDLRDAAWELAVDNAHIISLSLGQPQLELLPRALMHQATQRVLCEGTSFDARDLLQYPSNIGTRGYLNSLAEFLTRQYGYHVSADRLMSTNGNSNGLELCCSKLANPGDTILVEDPTYWLAYPIFADCHLNVVHIPQCASGCIDLDKLELMLESGEVRPKLLYTIPVFNNPTSACMTAENKTRLALLAQRFDFIVIADEVYQMLYFPSQITADQVPKSIAFYAQNAGCDDHVVSLGTFSKIVAPGLRLGWLDASDKHLQNMGNRGIFLSGGASNPLMGCLMEDLMRSRALDNHLETLRLEYETRARTLTDTLNAQCVPGLAEIAMPEGGYFMWFPLPNGMNAKQLLPLAKASGVSFYPGEAFSGSQASKFTSHIRLCFAYNSVENLRTAATRLAQVIAKQLN